MRSAISIARTPLFLGLAALTVAGCQDLKLQSRWADREIVIDGTAVEWEGRMTYFPESRIAVGVQNDETDLYVSVVTNDVRRQLQILHHGAVVWFDPRGGRSRSFGVRFPLGGRALGREEMEPPLDPGERPDLEPLIRMYQGTGAQVEILADGEVATRVPVEDMKGIEVAVNEIQGALVYEMKVPLKKSTDVVHAVGTKAGDVVGIGLETPEMDPDEMAERMPERRDMDPGSVDRDDMGGIRPGPMDDRDMPFPERVDFWVKVELAAPAGATP